jgi:hypothetical protein
MGLLPAHRRHDGRSDPQGRLRLLNKNADIYRDPRHDGTRRLAQSSTTAR